MKFKKQLFAALQYFAAAFVAFLLSLWTNGMFCTGPKIIADGQKVDMLDTAAVAAAIKSNNYIILDTCTFNGGASVYFLGTFVLIAVLVVALVRCKATKMAAKV